MRSAATLIKKGAKEGNVRPFPTAKNTAALRAGWMETLSRP
jgi:hypothetical protein